MNNKHFNAAIRIIGSCTTDKNGDRPTIKTAKLGTKKVLNVIYNDGITPEMENILVNIIPSSYGSDMSYGSIIGYPCIFDNKKGGGITKSFYVVWL